MFKDVPKVYLPILWLNLKVEVTKEMASDLKQLLALPTVMLCTGIIMAIVGLCLIGAVALLYLAKKQRVPPLTTVRGITYSMSSIRRVTRTENTSELNVRVLQEIATEKPIDESLEKKAETVYMDKIAANEDANVRSDRRLYAKLY